jgi:hypothetical protein
VRPADLERTLGRRFARLATNAVVARPRLWRLFRAPLRVQFDRLAPTWDVRRMPEAFSPLERALEAVPGWRPLRAFQLFSVRAP